MRHPLWKGPVLPHHHFIPLLVSVGVAREVWSRVWSLPIVGIEYPYTDVLIKTSGDQPSLPDLLRLKIPQQVGANYSIFGIFLLDDQTGSRVKTIEHDCHWQSETIVQKILQEWMERKGLPVTWESLVQTLKDTGLTVLADQIHHHVTDSKPPLKKIKL